MHPPEIPILGPLQVGSRQEQLVTLPGPLLNDEPRPLVTITGAHPGPTLFVGAGVHGGEYPAIEAVIRLSRTLDPKSLAGTVILMPVLNLPAFRSRSMFVCPVDNVNPNRVFPGDPEGSYSEQMTHALIHEFVAHADAYLDLHGGDIPEALTPFSICRGGDVEVDAKARELALAVGLPYVLAVKRPIQAAKGSSSYVAAAECGVPAVLLEAGGVGQLQEEAVEVLIAGVQRALAHLGMANSAVSAVAQPEMLTSFDWVYAQQAGMFYAQVGAGDLLEEGQVIGRVGSLFGETLETVTAPVAGRVLFLTVNPSVAAGGLLMGIGATG